ncbi:GyrI-like domain-containing protein [Roseivirga sp.]|uniref:GyrI-like domain-containing protein n=1 Tax=Roseivirga sp. TaxID=1964215 RepID=UPI003B52516A
MSITSVVNAQNEHQGSSIHELEGFKIIGISARIQNTDGKAVEAIEALWTKFWSEELMKKVPNKLSSDIYALYTDYESDFTGAYTFIIGMQVSAFDQVPEGFVTLEVGQDRYQEFVSKGKMPEAIVKTWTEIWADTTLQRTYHVDFTVHGEEYYMGDQAKVNTFISIKR